ncbi:hypothetical protein JVT61DRAFT_10391 [Boletus reticuloceps]|uniref:Uncharacterized protein n=1 Tax=Boletus reticuloceps TaxID=495285 RepID=A0A8I2YY27_9AGAM|nr:hypothetical protein JVT61DRAFT_10391 [Boletus reticuloceps]
MQSIKSIELYCTKIHSDFSIVDHAQDTCASVSNKDLLATWPSMWSSHVHTRHLGDLKFTCT